MTKQTYLFSSCSNTVSSRKNYCALLIQDCSEYIDVMYDSYLDDEECQKKYCFICDIPKKSMFILRGPIPTNTERKYFVRMNQKLTEIRGLIETECFWNKGKWEFGNNLKLDNATNKTPPVGLRNWNNGKKV